MCGRSRTFMNNPGQEPAREDVGLEREQRRSVSLVKTQSRGSVLVAAATALVLACAGSPKSEVERPGSPELPAEVEVARVSPVAGQLPQRVLLISIAGLTSAHYRPHGVGGGGTRGGRVMPALSRLATEGSFADEVVPVMPPTTYPVHASLVTGLSPGRHSITVDRTLDGRGLFSPPPRRADRLQGASLWRVARERQLSVAALLWPSTVGALIDLLLPDVVPRQPDEGWLGALEAEATPWILDRLQRVEPPLEAGEWPSAPERDALLTRLACDIVAQERTPALWLLRYGQTAEALLRHGPGSEGARTAFARVDAELAGLVGCLRERGLLQTSALVVVGDRRVFPVHTRVDPNVALLDAGLIIPPASGLAAGVRGWVAIAHSHGGSAVVYAEDESAALLARRALELAADDTRAFRVVSARELRALGADPRAWFGLEAAPGYIIGAGYDEPSLRAAQLRGVGGYLPTKLGSGVGFVAWGAGLRPGVRVPSMRQIDVAPTVAALLGFDLEGADGRPLIGVLGVDPRTRAPR